mgnify:CR=1 FL=1
MLKRKMLRDIKRNLSQFITIFLMVLIGVMVYTGIEAYMGGMQKTADRFYDENNLFDLEVIGNNFTEEDLENIKRIENVNNAERKLSVNATTDDDKVLLLNFIESNNISRFYIVDGLEFDSNKSGVWLDAFYARENNIKVGDTILVKYDTLKLNEKVIGLINVPDHLYDTKDESELYPNRKEFGFAYLSINELPASYIKEKVMEEMNISSEEEFDKQTPDFNYREYLTYNYVMVDVNDVGKRDIVKNQIEDNVANALAIIDRENIASYSVYQGEIDEGKTYVGVFSGLFIFIAILSVITTMTRVVKNQRVQIGTLKALGFSNFRILMHYIGYGFWISLFGVIAGLIVGYYGIGNLFIGIEMSFFEVPNGAPCMNYTSYIVGASVILCVILIIYITGRKILSENPAEALRNKIPNVKKGSLNLTRKGIFKKLNFSTKWNLRDIIRNKIRTFMGIAGVTGCAMLIVCALGMLDSINYFVKLQFEDLYNFDYKLVLKENISNEELNKLKFEYGDFTSETIGIEIKTGDKRESNNIVVTDAKDRLRFVNKSGKFIDINSNDGVYVTYKLAELNNYKIGDEITWHIYGDSTYYTSVIVGFNKDPQNQNITMTKAYLESLNINYKPDVIYTNNNLSGVSDIEGVDLIQNIESLKVSMNNMLSMMKSMIVLIIGIAVFLGTIIIYNLGILSYSEKQYQFATLKVLGFDDRKIKNIFIKQNNWISIISIILGLPLGYYLTNWLFKTAIEEHYDFGASINMATYIIAGFGTFIVSYIVSKVLARKIKNIDMVSSLKGNE